MVALWCSIRQMWMISVNYVSFCTKSQSSIIWNKILCRHILLSIHNLNRLHDVRDDHNVVSSIWSLPISWYNCCSVRSGKYGSYQWTMFYFALNVKVSLGIRNKILYEKFILSNNIVRTHKFFWTLCRSIRWMWRISVNDAYFYFLIKKLEFY